MNREPITPDDPDLTAYALGELNLTERREFEAKLESSPTAQVELESMEDMMSLLSKGLKEEWATEMNEPSLEVLPNLSGASDEKIVRFPFGRSKKAVGAIAAAAAAVALFAGSLVSFKEVPGGSSLASFDGGEFGGSVLVASLGAPGVPVPTLEMNQEMEDMGDLSLSEAIENLENLEVPVDASYLESRTVVPVSHRVQPASNGIVPASYSGRSSDRVDSYLPPVPGKGAPKTGLIEQRINGSQEGARIPVGDSTNVVVTGFVSLDDVAQSLRSQSGLVLQGFQPVSMMGQPIRSSVDDLRLMAEMQIIQQEIQSVVEQLPQGSEERVQLQQLLERNQRAIGDMRSRIGR